MATVERNDCVAWISKIRGDTDLVERLQNMQPEEQVTLNVDGVVGTWRRMRHQKNDPTKPTLGVRPIADAALAWRSIPSGTIVSVDLDSAEGDDEAALAPPPMLTIGHRDGPLSLRKALRPSLVEDGKPVLCMGVDFAWWGGSRGDRASMTDTIVYAVCGGGCEDRMHIQRVDLAASFRKDAPLTEANCDPDSRLLIDTFAQIIAHHEDLPVILAVDAPLLALQRPHLPVRSRASIRGTMERRQADNALQAGCLADKSDWRRLCNIQPGAPICARVLALTQALNDELGFHVYGIENSSSRLLVECFPGEAFWSLGVLGHYADLTFDEVTAFKRSLPDSGWLAWPRIMNAVYCALSGFRPLINDKSMFDRWLADLTVALLSDSMITAPDGNIARGGKALDDMVESVASFFIAVCLALDRAHIWEGSDPNDGHIIGPGLS